MSRPSAKEFSTVEAVNEVLQPLLQSFYDGSLVRQILCLT